MASDFFLKIPNIPGESQEQRHAGWIEVESWSFSISNATDPGRGNAATKSVANFSEFTFSKRGDKASPQLFATVCKGEHIDDLTFAGVKAGAKQGNADYLTIKFKDCIISNFAQSGGGDSESAPMESISFAFSEIYFDYQQIDVKGNLAPAASFKFDLKRNQPM